MNFKLSQLDHVNFRKITSVMFNHQMHEMIRTIAKIYMKKRFYALDRIYNCRY